MEKAELEAILIIHLEGDIWIDLEIDKIEWTNPYFNHQN